MDRPSRTEKSRRNMVQERPMSNHKHWRGDTSCHQSASRLPSVWSPRHSTNDPVGRTSKLVARTPARGNGLRERMCRMSTQQGQHSTNPCSAPTHICKTGGYAFRNRNNRLHHEAPRIAGIRFNTYGNRPRLLKSNGLHTMRGGNIQRRNRHLIR